MYNLSLSVFYMGPYSGASGAGVPKNGASRLCSYPREESVSVSYHLSMVTRNIILSNIIPGVYDAHIF